MKCPKCGYLGFETTDRCRNCQYDFSLAPFSPEPELTLHGADRKNESPTDFDLPPIKRQSDKLTPPRSISIACLAMPSQRATVPPPAPSASSNRRCVTG